MTTTMNINTTVIQPATPNYKTISTAELREQLQTAGVTVNAIHSNGRYLCRAKDADGKNIAAASSKSLVDALANIAGKIAPEKEGVTV